MRPTTELAVGAPPSTDVRPGYDVAASRPMNKASVFANSITPARTSSAARGGGARTTGSYSGTASVAVPAGARPDPGLTPAFKDKNGSDTVNR